MARRRVNVFSLSFLDAMTCGCGALVLFFMIINAAAGQRAGRLTHDRQAEVDRLEIEVLDGHERLVELRNSLREVKQKLVTASGLATVLIQALEEIQVELATYDSDTLAKKESVNQLKSDLKVLEEDD